MPAVCHCHYNCIITNWHLRRICLLLFYEFWAYKRHCGMIIIDKCCWAYCLIWWLTMLHIWVMASIVVNYLTYYVAAKRMYIRKLYGLLWFNLLFFMCARVGMTLVSLTCRGKVRVSTMAIVCANGGWWEGFGSVSRLHSLFSLSFFIMLTFRRGRSCNYKLNELEALTFVSCCRLDFVDFNYHFLHLLLWWGCLLGRFSSC